MLAGGLGGVRRADDRKSCGWVIGNRARACLPRQRALGVGRWVLAGYDGMEPPARGPRDGSPGVCRPDEPAVRTAELTTLD